MDEDKALDVLALAIGLTIVAVLTVGALSDIRWPDLFPREEPAPRERPVGAPAPPPAQQPAPSPLGPNEVAELPPITAEYVASVVWRSAHQAERRTEIVYAGGWKVEHSTTDEDDARSYYEHLRSGEYFTWTRNSDRTREWFSADEREPRDRVEVAYTNTGQTRHEGAETCTIWSARWRDPPSYGENRPWRMCITGDGIMLWSREHHLPERETFRVLALERRTISAAEVRPPALLFDWRYWSAGPDPSGDDLAVDMFSPPDASQHDEQILRVRGAWTSTVINDDPGSRRHEISGPNLYFQYYLHEETRALRPGEMRTFRSRHMDISRQPRREPPPRGGTLVTPRRSETILGRRCEWYDLPAPSHSFSTECRTRDGFTLAIHGGGDGARGGDRVFSVRATRVSRDLLPASAVVPPAEAFSWAH